jgi:hypothetical protein
LSDCSGDGDHGDWYRGYSCSYCHLCWCVGVGVDCYRESVHAQQMYLKIEIDFHVGFDVDVDFDYYVVAFVVLLVSIRCSWIHFLYLLIFLCLSSV